LLNFKLGLEQRQRHVDRARARLVVVVQGPKDLVSL
jgi:hypothetical protein